MQQNSKINLIKLFKGSLVGSAILFLAVSGATFMIYKLNINESSYMPILLVCSVITGFVSGFLGTRKIRQNGIINGLISSIIPAILMFMIVSIATSTFELSNLIIPVIIFIGGIVGGITAVNLKMKMKKKR